MRKYWKFFILFFLAIFISGCGKSQPHPPAVVTGVEICLQNEEGTFRREYTQDRQIRKILDQLRLQRITGAVTDDPERLVGDVYEIRVRLCDGRIHIYRYRCGYLSKDSRPWEKVDPKLGQTLYSFVWAQT